MTHALWTLTIGVSIPPTASVGRSPFSDEAFELSARVGRREAVPPNGSTEPAREPARDPARKLNSRSSPPLSELVSLRGSTGSSKSPNDAILRSEAVINALAVGGSGVSDSCNECEA